MVDSSADRSESISDVLRQASKLKHERVETGPLDPRLALLRKWQNTRLARTHADQVANPRYRPTWQFFLQEVYAPRDFSQRNHDILRMYELMEHLVPEPLTRPLILTVELNEQTDKLDAQLLDVLVNQLGLTDRLTVPLYAEAYRLCNNYDERVRQIELIHDVVYMLDAVVHMPGSGMMLTLAKLPLKRAGWKNLMDFMEHGYKAVKHMRGVEEFLDNIRTRELHILNRIYEKDSDPFGFQLDGVNGS